MGQGLEDVVAFRTLLIEAQGFEANRLQAPFPIFIWQSVMFPILRVVDDDRVVFPLH